MAVFYAIFYPLEKGWGVRFPDAPAINTFGEDVEEALSMAVDALSGLLVVGRKGREYEEPRKFEDIQAEAKEGELIFPVTPDENIMKEYRPKKRINVMIPVDLLNKIGESLKDKKGLNRSEFICTAVEEHLAQKGL
ncbi:MAG: hypothetical protein GY737_27015 [Desulfobacteraceae bacterium]|nr:hypothetical protein [Desulfobacteraceae bacterium]